MAHWLREELAARPGRWREAAEISLAATLAMAIALFLQFGSFPAPLLAFKALQPGVASTWRNLTPRMIAIAGAAVFVTLTAGVLVQVPWLLVPAFFALIVAITYLVPIRAFPIGGYALALIMAGVLFTGIYDPQAIGAKALQMSVAFAIGLLVATAFEELAGTGAPRDHLAASLASGFTKARAILARARAQLDAPPVGGDSEMVSQLATHMQLLTLVRQDTHDRILDRAFVALITVAERAALFASLAEAATRHPARPDFRAAFQPALDAVLDALDFALARYAAAARRPELLVVTDTTSPAAPPWPDFSALLGALRAQHASPATRDALGTLDSAGAATLNGFLQAVEGLTDVVHSAPEAFEHIPVETDRPLPPRLLPPFDPFAFQFALKIGLAAVIALIVGIVSHTVSMETIILNPLIVVQGSYGATLRRAGLRITGVVAGGALAVLVAASVMANTDNIGVWLVAFFLILLPCAYIALGTVRLGYFGLQVAVTFMIVMVADGPVVDIGTVLWRFYGTLLGAVLLFGVFQIVAPDYAGRQLVQRFIDLLRAVRASTPEPGGTVPPLARTVVLNDAITAGLADVLRLAGEARFEGLGSGVDADAAINAAGLLRRIAHRWALIRRARRVVTRPTAAPGLAAATAAVETIARQRLDLLRRVLEARHHRARPASRIHDTACANARALAACERPDLGGPWAAYLAAFEAARETLRAWPIEAREAQYAETGHLQRIVELMPKLEREVMRTVLPDLSGAAAVPRAHDRIVISRSSAAPASAR